MVEKIINVEVKVSLKSSSEIRKIDSRCPKGYKLSAKKEKDKTSQKHQDRDKDKTKSHNLFFTNMNKT